MNVTMRAEVKVLMSKKQYDAVEYLIKVALSNRKSMADLAVHPHIEFYELEHLLKEGKTTYE